MGGVAVRSEDLSSIEAKMNDLALKVFNRRLLEHGTEFHGRDIFHGKSSFKGMDSQLRLEIFKELLAICASKEIFRFYIKIIPANFVYPQEPDEVAFMYLVEQIDKFLVRSDSLGMLIGDMDEPKVGPTVASLSQYRDGGTYWAKGTKIDRLIDTVHFARSHHSRLIQLADVYLYARQFYRASYDAVWHQKYNEAIINSGVLSAAISKTWPSERRWYHR